MDPRLFLSLARGMLAQLQVAKAPPSPTDSAASRSIISRSYYAAFLVALEFLHALGLQVTRSGACHVTVQYALNNCGESDLATASTNLGTLYSERRSADYDMKSSRTESTQQATDMADLADETIALITQCVRQCRANQAKTQTITKAILDWAKQNGQQKNIWQ